MAPGCKPITIPVELLRRSTRLRNHVIANTKRQGYHLAEGDKNGRQNPDLKHFKTDDQKDVAESMLRHQIPIKLELPGSSDDAAPPLPPPPSALKVGEKLEIKTELMATDATTREHPDGMIEIDSYELDLERTLMGGQSFRWTKSDDSIFTGVIGNNALKLWRHDNARIAFKRLNRESQDCDQITKLLGDYFQLKYNLRDLYQEWSRRDKHLESCCKDYIGFRILRQDPVENVFSFICATNNNIKRISQMIEKLCNRFGNILESMDKESSIYDSYRAFPNVERLAQDDVFDCLRYELGFGYRAKFITETAKKLMDLSRQEQQSQQNTGPRDYLVSLRGLPYKETCKRLTQFPGIGRKVADCICLMSMDHLQAVPIDCHIYEIVCRNYMPKLRQERKTLTESVHDLIGDYFNDLHGPLAGWATSVLFIAELKHLKLEKKADEPKTTTTTMTAGDGQADAGQNEMMKKTSKSKKHKSK